MIKYSQFASKDPPNIPQGRYYIFAVVEVDKATETPLEPLTNGEKEQEPIEDTIPFDLPSSYASKSPASTYSHTDETFLFPIGRKAELRHDGDARKGISQNVYTDDQLTLNGLL